MLAYAEKLSREKLTFKIRRPFLKNSVYAKYPEFYIPHTALKALPHYVIKNHKQNNHTTLNNCSLIFRQFCTESAETSEAK